MSLLGKRGRHELAGHLAVAANGVDRGNNSGTRRLHHIVGLSGETQATLLNTKRTILAQPRVRDCAASNNKHIAHGSNCRLLAGDKDISLMYK